MPDLMVKNSPDDLYMQLELQAVMHHHSFNREVIVCIERAVQSSRLQPEAFVRSAQVLREKTAHYPITDDAFNEAKAKGRL